MYEAFFGLRERPFDLGQEAFVIHSGLAIAFRLNSGDPLVFPPFTVGDQFVRGVELRHAPGHVQRPGETCHS